MSRPMLGLKLNVSLSTFPDKEEPKKEAK